MRSCGPDQELVALPAGGGEIRGPFEQPGRIEVGQARRRRGRPTSPGIGRSILQPETDRHREVVGKLGQRRRIGRVRSALEREAIAAWAVARSYGSIASSTAWRARAWANRYWPTELGTGSTRPWTAAAASARYASPADRPGSSTSREPVHPEGLADHRAANNDVSVKGMEPLQALSDEHPQRARHRKLTRSKMAEAAVTLQLPPDLTEQEGVAASRRREAARPRSERQRRRLRAGRSGTTTPPRDRIRRDRRAGHRASAAAPRSGPRPEPRRPAARCGGWRRNNTGRSVERSTR